jgi:transposase
MAGQYEEADEVDVVERSFRIVRHKRQKYRCACGGCVDTALGPAKLVPGGRYSVVFAAAVAAGKYCDHLPLSRQCDQMRRQGLEVDSQTLWNQLDALARHLQGSYEALRSWVLAEPVAGADETRWPLLDGDAKTWWAWSATSRRGAWYRIAKSRSHEEAGELLGDFAGVVISDAYSAYPALQKARARAGPTFKLTHCWAHVRRKYVQAEPYHPEAKGILALISELYAIEKEAQQGVEPGSDAWRERLYALRQAKSREVIARIRTWRQGVHVLPKSSLGRATSYMEDNWQELQVFLSDALVPLDNNDTERAIRGLAVGRKNHYGSKSKRGTEVAALFYSLVETCKRLGIEPTGYLQTAALHAIAHPGAVLLPHQYAESVPA